MSTDNPNLQPTDNVQTQQLTAESAAPDVNDLLKAWNSEGYADRFNSPARSNITDGDASGSTLGHHSSAARSPLPPQAPQVQTPMHSPVTSVVQQRRKEPLSPFDGVKRRSWEVDSSHAAGRREIEAQGKRDTAMEEKEEQEEEIGGGCSGGAGCSQGGGNERRGIQDCRFERDVGDGPQALDSPGEREGSTIREFEDEVQERLEDEGSEIQDHGDGLDKGAEYECECLTCGKMLLALGGFLVFLIIVFFPPWTWILRRAPHQPHHHPPLPSYATSSLPLSLSSQHHTITLFAHYRSLLDFSITACNQTPDSITTTLQEAQYQSLTLIHDVSSLSSFQHWDIEAWEVFATRTAELYIRFPFDLVPDQGCVQAVVASNAVLMDEQGVVASLREAALIGVDAL
ncbi:hypothetical protein Tdes44962_MAKER09854 [Teratosphaeria destructans]|uniref:Uncharacterized protein n=1 Tax=Teratosphaeria destructans TaxID=418781 RepID=A0A9W7W1X5_9PEZI|nr:hypothetical protein Tdes44962_MAKER09854 [Teratosphaeria destructans]